MEEVPEAGTQDKQESERGLTGASRLDRLWASLIDGIVIVAFVLPAMYLTGGFDGVSEGTQPSLSYSLVMAMFGIIVFAALNGKLLLSNGQTIGKKVLGIKIVTLSGDLPNFKDHLVKRYGTYFVLGQIPLAGPILSNINLLMIFGKQKRCGHDLVAGTKVVDS